MCEVILIGTVHKERGICNSNELLKIIEKIRPEVIYEEIPPDKFTAIYEEEIYTDSLETETIKRYLVYDSIHHFPVDLNVEESMERQFRIDVMRMFNTFDQYQEVLLLKNRHEELVKKLGFPYLNSRECVKLFEHLHVLEKEILRVFSNNEKFHETYEKWLTNLEERENEMIKQIYSFSSKYEYKRALFLVGTEHRKSIMKKVLKFEENHKLKLIWNFDYFNN